MAPFKTLAFIKLGTNGLPEDTPDLEIRKIFVQAYLVEHIRESDEHVPLVDQSFSACVDPESIDGSELYTLDYEELLGFLNGLQHPVCLIANNGNRFDFPILWDALNYRELSFRNDLQCVDSIDIFKTLDNASSESYSLKSVADRYRLLGPGPFPYDAVDKLELLVKCVRKTKHDFLPLAQRFAELMCVAALDVIPPFTHFSLNTHLVSARRSLPTMASKTLAFFKLDTTDLPQNDPQLKITKISVLACSVRHILLKTAGVEHQFSICVNPEQNISTPAMEVSGLTNFGLHKERPFSRDVAQLLLDFLGHLQQPVCLIAHCGDGFDFPILRKAFGQCNVRFPVNLRTVDSLPIFKKLDGNPYQSFSLPDVAERLLGEKSAEDFNEFAWGKLKSLLKCVRATSPKFLRLAQEYSQLIE